MTERNYRYGEDIISSVSNLADIERFITFPKDLSGKLVADIGSGVSTVVPELIRQGAIVYAIDPRLSDLSGMERSSQEYLDILLTDAQWTLWPLKRINMYRAHSRLMDTKEDFFSQLRSQRGNNAYIAASADELPLPSNMFDYVFSVKTISRFTHNQELLINSFQEALRILKVGGVFETGPWKKFLPPDEKEHADALLHYLHRNKNNRVEIVSKIGQTFSLRVYKG